MAKAKNAPAGRRNKKLVIPGQVSTPTLANRQRVSNVDPEVAQEAGFGSDQKPDISLERGLAKALLASALELRQSLGRDLSADDLPGVVGHWYVYKRLRMLVTGKRWQISDGVARGNVPLQEGDTAFNFMAYVLSQQVTVPLLTGPIPEECKEFWAEPMNKRDIPEIKVVAVGAGSPPPRKDARETLADMTRK